MAARWGKVLSAGCRRQAWRQHAGAVSVFGLATAGTFHCGGSDFRVIRMEDTKDVSVNSISVGTKYVARFGDGTNTPWLENEALKKRVAENRLQRWDGVEGTIQEHGQWMLSQARSLLSDERRSEWREYGKKSGCQYYIHDQLTKEGQGYALVKIEADLKLEPRDMIAWMFDMQGLCDADKTVVLMKVLRLFQPEKVGDPFHICVYWANAPGFPFRIRDGLDISSFHKDDDGTVWQMSVSTPDDLQSQPGAQRAIDRYWAYKLEPGENGLTKTTLICQTLLHGHIPKFLSNRMLCRVLIDYMEKIVSEVEKKKLSGEYEAILAQLKLTNF